MRYRPTKPRDDLDQLSLMFKLLVSIVDHVVASLQASGDSAPDWATAVQQMDLLKEPMEWIGPVFCNTVRPLLLVQGRWSYQVSADCRPMEGSRYSLNEVLIAVAGRSGMEASL